jgi:hypothetical protein
MDHEPSIIPQISEIMRNSLASELAKMDPDMDANEAVLQATRNIAARIKNKEYNLVDMTNRGDMLALALAEGK